MQFVFESSMYIFVFLWSPVLEGLNESNVNFGLVFSTFMVYLMIGSLIFRAMNSKGMKSERILLFVFTLASVAFLSTFGLMV
jgi:MFS transporter, MFS domain-containing protein family, molybdate-anion transporter